MVIHKPCVATTSYVASTLTIAGPALVEEQEGGIDGVLAVQYRVSDNYKSQDVPSDFGMISFMVDNELWSVGSLRPGNSCGRNYFKIPENGSIIIINPCITAENKENLMRSNSDYSVSGSDAPVAATSVVATNINKKDKELYCQFVKNSKTLKATPSTGLTLMVNQPSTNAAITFPTTFEGAFWQSFTATQSSKLKKIAFSFGYNSLIDVTVIIREGEGIDNTNIIYIGTWTTNTGDLNWTEYILDSASNVPKLKKNQKYTIQFTEFVNPQTSIMANQGSIYDGGKFYSTNYSDLGDLKFKVWVEPEPESDV